MTSINSATSDVRIAPSAPPQEPEGAAPAQETQAPKPSQDLGFDMESRFDSGGIHTLANIDHPRTPGYITPEKPLPDEPPPSQEQINRAEAEWQKYVGQFGQNANKVGTLGPANAELYQKAGEGLPDGDAERIRQSGIKKDKNGKPLITYGPNHRPILVDFDPNVVSGPWVSGRSKVKGNEDTPAFNLDYYDTSKSPKKLAMQIYTFVREPQGTPEGTKLNPTERKNWSSFEVFGNILDAYNDDKFTGKARGTNSVLGFPLSGRENSWVKPPLAPDDAKLTLEEKRQQSPILQDRDVREFVSKQVKAGKDPEKVNVPFQVFQGGFLVDLGDKVIAFKKDGTRMGTPYVPGNPAASGAMGERVAPTGPGSAGKPGSVYQPYEVANGVKVNGRLGFSWHLQLGQTHNDPNRKNDPHHIDNVLKRADKILAAADTLGAGYTTVVLGPGSETKANEPLIRKLVGSTVTPVVRLYTDAAPDKWNEKDASGKSPIDHMVEQAQELKRMGVKVIQIGNEPNLNGESHLKDGDKPMRKSVKDYITDSTKMEAEALLAVKKAVGNDVAVGLPPVAAGSADQDPNIAPQTYYPELLKAIKAVEDREHRTIVDYIPTHNYNNIDRASPTDKEGAFGNTVGSGGARGQLGWGPDTNHWYEERAQELLGRNLKTLSTEGGAGPNAFRDRADVRQEHVRRETVDTLAQLNGDSTLTANLWLLQSKNPQSDPDNWELLALEPGSDANGPEHAWDAGLAYLEQKHQEATRAP